MNPCHNPRLTREADTLSELGHDVRVVAPSRSAYLGEKDRRLLSTRKWRLDSVDVEVDGKRSRAAAFLARAKRRLAEEAAQWVRSLWIYERAYTPAYSELVARACREPADWYIAHAQGALPVAARAAARWNGKMGFDCEDLLSLSRTDPTEVVLALEKTYLGKCAYVSVTSQCMADYLTHQYRMKPPIILYNVFPLALAAGLPSPDAREPRTAETPLRLHWFGQTVGTGRGLEEIIDAMAAVNGPAELHLRGNVRPEFRAALLERARERGRAEAVHFHPLVDHDEVIRQMRGFDVGLALERPDDDNYSRTVTNKFFSYMLAGLAVLATDTPGQREVCRSIPDAATLYSAGDTRALAGILQGWLDQPQRLRAAQVAAWNATRERYCWDIESRKLVERIAGAGAAGGA